MTNYYFIKILFVISIFCYLNSISFYARATEVAKFELEHLIGISSWGKYPESIKGFKSALSSKGLWEIRYKAIAPEILLESTSSIDKEIILFIDFKLSKPIDSETIKEKLHYWLGNNNLTGTVS